MTVVSNSKLHDKRLLGTWCSDARRTGKEISARNDIPKTQKKRLKKFFGKLQIKYTRARAYATLDGSTESWSYKVVGKDSTSVVILGRTEPEESPLLTHIHFEEPFFWISLGNGRIREFFKRQ
jgi:hypothetical protein